MNINKKMLPRDLARNGFCGTGGSINIDSLSPIREFIRNNFEKQKTINPSKTSHGLKHIVEHEINIDVSNGDLIASMILEGFEYAKYDEKNARFNLKQSSLKPFLSTNNDTGTAIAFKTQD